MFVSMNNSITILMKIKAKSFDISKCRLNLKYQQFQDYYGEIIRNMDGRWNY